MSQFFQFEDHIMLLASYQDPAAHQHLASHMILSFSEKMTWKIGDETVTCMGICMGPNVRHSGITGHGDSLVFMFTEVSSFALSLNQKYLHGRPYAVLEDAMARQACSLYEDYQAQPALADAKILAACGLDNTVAPCYDSRVQAVINKVEQMETIPENSVAELSRAAFLSASRLSHLFHQQTGMALRSYLAFEKLRKTYRYYRGGKNITDSCMLAGFDSPSHCSATCKKMFGISIRDVQHTIAAK